MPRSLFPRWLVVAVNSLLFGASCGGGGAASSRYMLARDPGSRYDFRYVMDRQNRRWVQRECELRVSTARRLPDPLLDLDHGNRLQVSLQKSGSVGSAGVMSLDFETRDGFRVWKIRDVLHEDDATGRTAYGVTVSWPQEGTSTEFDAYELFPLPPLGNVPPDTWSEWKSAASLREGGMGWWEEVQGEPPTQVALPKYPFELRYRLILTDNPVLIP